MSSAAKILLIEDDPGIVVSLRRLLAEEGYEVLVETRGDTGLARAREQFSGCRHHRHAIARLGRT